jgi:hypothetical protein
MLQQARAETPEFRRLGPQAEEVVPEVEFPQLERSRVLREPLRFGTIPLSPNFTPPSAFHSLCHLPFSPLEEYIVETTETNSNLLKDFIYLTMTDFIL